MALIYSVGSGGQCAVTGLSTDVKPQYPGDGFFFTEIDTNKTFYSFNTSWVEAVNVTYATTGGFYITGSSQTLWPNSKILSAGSSVTIHTDDTAFYINATTSIGASSAGLAGTGSYYIVGSAQPLLPGSRILMAGSSITMVTDATAFYITAITSIYAGSAGLAGTGFYYLVGSNMTGLPSSKVIRAGSAVTIHTDSTSFYINATTSLGAGSAGLAGTGANYVTFVADSTLSNEKVLTAGSSVTMHTDSTAIYINATTSGGAGVTEKGIEYWHSLTVNTGAFLANRVRMYLAGQDNATALGATIIPINSACAVPFISTKNITIDTMGFAATIAGSATTFVQLGIYTNSSDTVLYPHQAVSTSGFLSGTNTTVMGYNPAITLSANNLYWFICYIAKSAITLRTIAVGGAIPIYGMGTDLSTAPGIYLQCPMVGLTSTGLPETMGTSGNIMTTALPALAIRGSI